MNNATEICYENLILYLRIDNQIIGVAYNKSYSEVNNSNFEFYISKYFLKKSKKQDLKKRTEYHVVITVFRVKKRGGYQAPRESSITEVAATQSSDMKGSKRDWIFRVQVI